MHRVGTDNHEMFVVPAEAGIQRLKSLDPGQKHAGMTIKWDSTESGAFNYSLFSEIQLAFSYAGPSINSNVCAYSAAFLPRSVR